VSASSTGAIGTWGLKPAEQDLNQHHADQHVERGLQQADRRQTEKQAGGDPGGARQVRAAHPQEQGQHERLREPGEEEKSRDRCAHEAGNHAPCREQIQLGERRDELAHRVRKRRPQTCM